MKKEEIQLLFSQFEQASCSLNDVECWSARDLCTLLGYKLWQNFTKVIDKAKEACANVGQHVEDHFIDVNKMVFNMLTYVSTGFFSFIYYFCKILPKLISQKCA